MFGKNYYFQTADHIVAGRGALHSLSEHLHVCGEVKSALILTQAFTVRLGYVDRVVQQMEKAGVSSQVLTGVMNEPTVDNIMQLHHETKDEPYDLLIGIGGGSVLDATKILSVLRTNNDPLESMLGTNLVKNAGTPIILIPTTSGTGSEVTPNAIVTFPKDELKIGVVSRFLLPAIALIDPELTLELPKPITASTGMDAFTHALESFISNKANPISDMFALESIRKISDSISIAYHQGDSLEAREGMLIGSMYGGMALTSAGTAAVHALAYPLGGKFHIPHGVANSMLLPHVMNFNMDSIQNRLAAVAQTMRLPESRTGSANAAAEAVVSKITEWTKDFQIPQDLRAFGVGEKDIAELAIAASKVTRLLNNNPKSMEISQIEEVYRKLLT